MVVDGGEELQAVAVAGFGYLVGDGGGVLQYCDAHRYTDLRGGQANAGGSQHGAAHQLDELGQQLVVDLAVEGVGDLA